MKYLGKDFITKDNIYYYSKLEAIAAIASRLGNKILITGIGDGYIGNCLIDKDVTYVELNQQYLRNTEHKAIHVDAEKYLRSSDVKQYDLVIINHYIRNYNIRRLKCLTLYLNSIKKSWISYFDPNILDRFLAYEIHK